MTRFSLSTKLLSFPLGNSSGTLDVGCAVSQPNLPVWTLPKCTKTFTTSFELEWTQTKATRVLSPGQLCPSALVQQGRKQAQGSSLASGVLGENSLASKSFSVKNNFFAFQLEQRRKENWPIYLWLCFFFFFLMLLSLFQIQGMLSQVSLSSHPSCGQDLLKIFFEDNVRNICCRQPEDRG